jgi:hypothetical protein
MTREAQDFDYWPDLGLPQIRVAEMQKPASICGCNRPFSGDLKIFSFHRVFF